MKEGGEMEEYVCPICHKESDSTDAAMCLKCMKMICRDCYVLGHKESCKGTGETATFIFKVVIGLLLSSVAWNATINGSEEMSIDRLIMMYAFFTIPFGWSFIGYVKDSLLRLIGIRVKKKKIYELTQEDEKKFIKNAIIKMIFLPKTLISYLLQALISALIGMVAFPVEVIRKLLRKKRDQ